VAWSASKIFMSYLEDVVENTTAIDLNTDTFKIALYDNDITPDQTVASASAAYNAGQWTASGNEVSDAAEWPSTGQALGSVTSAFSSNVFTFDAADEVSDGTSATLANVYGGLIYDDSIAAPVAKPGVCYLYFGGVNSVTDGTFTVQFHGSGIFTVTA
jgi:hypothetical protein